MSLSTGLRIAAARTVASAGAANAVTVLVRAAVALGALGCGARPHAAPSARATDEVRLYRDRALVEQRVEIVATATGRITVPLRVPAGVGPNDIVVIDRGDGERSVALARAHPTGAAPAVAPPHAAVTPRGPVTDSGAPIADALEADSDDGGADEPDEVVVDPPRPELAGPPSELTLTLDAPRPGRFVVSLGYATARLRWDAEYTMTTGPAHDRAVVRGTITIRNTTGVALRAHTQVFDAELGIWHDHLAEHLGRALVGVATTTPPQVPARDLGVVALGHGDTPVELLAGDPPRALRSVLVYDPIGSGLDHPGAAPAADPELGANTHMTTRITESVELARDPRAHRGLPAGAVKLLERRADGSLAVLGAARLFDHATQVARADTVPIGTAAGLVGHRERRDWAKDDDQRRFSEEFLLTIDNARPRPVEVVVREHLYRGQNWTLAYQSAPASKEGAQQIALRAAVPANGRAKVLYVVVYTW